MKAVVLAGGYGTRISEETGSYPACTVAAASSETSLKIRFSAAADVHIPEGRHCDALWAEPTAYFAQG